MVNSKKAGISLVLVLSCIAFPVAYAADSAKKEASDEIQNKSADDLMCVNYTIKAGSSLKIKADANRNVVCYQHGKKIYDGLVNSKVAEDAVQARKQAENLRLKSDSRSKYSGCEIQQNFAGDTILVCN